MKFDAPQPASLVHRVDVWVSVLGIMAAAVFVGSASVIFSLDSSSPINSALYGESGMWSALGQKE